MRRIARFTMVWLLAAASDAAAQDNVAHRPCTGFGTTRHELARLAEVAGETPVAPWLVRRGMIATSSDACGATIWPASTSLENGATLMVLPAELALAANSGYAADRNNGVMWGGRGLASRLSAGAAFEWGPLRAALAPALVWHQNADFDTRTVTNLRYDPLAYPWHGHRIDYPQRFGEESFWTLDPGQSFVALHGFGATLGFSTQNMWWGPALRNPILMSNTSQGFPHVYLGTDGPLGSPVGALQVEGVWGHLRESEYFDTIPDNETRLFTGIVGSWSPRWVAGLELGGARVYYRTLPPEGLELRDYVPFFESTFKDELVTPDNPTGNDLSDQLLSLFGRWVFPASGLELYGEWSKNDHNSNVDNFVQEPEHAQGWTWGVQKLFFPDTDRERWLRGWFEATHLDGAITRLDRVHPTFYVHGLAQGGYTHRGQLLGASIGPGGNAQALGVDLFSGRGVVGVFAERVRRDSDEYYRTQKRWAGDPGSSPANPNRACGCGDWTQDVELTLGTRATLLLARFDIEGALSYSHRRHRNFLDRNESNFALELSATFRPGVEAD